MLPKYHIFLGMIFSVLIFIAFPSISLIGFLIIFLSSFLIDVDHYLSYLFSNKDFKLNNAYKFFYNSRKKNLALKNKSKLIPDPKKYLLHGFEVLGVLFILNLFVSEIFLFISIGFIFHLFLDVLEQIYYKLPIGKISLTYDFIRLKKFNKKSGK